MMFVSKNVMSRPLLRISVPLKFTLVFALATALAAGFTLRTSFAQEAIVLVGSGSSVPAPLYNRWAAEYNKRNPAIQFRYLPIGASGE
jgi:phosphate transport system substrate-binding protein